MVENDSGFDPQEGRIADYARPPLSTGIEDGPAHLLKIPDAAGKLFGGETPIFY